MFTTFFIDNFSIIAGARRRCDDFRATQCVGAAEQRSTARHPEAEQIGRKIGVAHVHDHATGGVRAMQALDALSARERRIAQSKRIEHTQPSRLQQEASANRM